MIRLAALILLALPAFAQHWVSMTWPASATATSYNVYRANASGGPYVYLETVATTYAEDHTVTDGIQYCYAITAIATGGESGRSAESCVLIPVTDTPDPCGAGVVPSTFLRASIGSGDTSIPLEQIGCWITSQSNYGLLIEKEYMSVTAPPTIADVTATGRTVWMSVLRGAFGTRARSHTAGAVVWYGPVASFQTAKPPKGSCIGLTTPWIEIYSGFVWDCAGGTWVKRP